MCSPACYIYFFFVLKFITHASTLSDKLIYVYNICVMTDLQQQFFSMLGQIAYALLLFVASWVDEILQICT